MIGETASAAAVCMVALFCVLGACAVVGLAAAAYLTPIAATLNELFQKTALPSTYLEILWKALGICYLTGIAGDLCQDCGESALAHMAELW